MKFTDIRKHLNDWSRLLTQTLDRCWQSFGPTWQMAGLTRHLALLVVWLVLLMGAWWFGRPIVERLQADLALRPAQWGHAQQLFAIARSPSAPARMVPQLNEEELVRIRTLLANQGIKPGVLRLTTDNPPQLEMQLNTVLFASLVEVLEELRRTWHIFPIRANVQASGQTGIVNASFTLEQVK